MLRASRGLVATAAVIALTVPNVIPAQAAGADDRAAAGRAQMTRRAVPEGLKVDVGRGPAKRPRKVIVQLAADPAAVVAGRAAEAGEPLTRTQQRAAAAAATRAQARAGAAATGAGATITARYTRTLNGFAMTATPSQIRAVAALSEVVAVQPVRRVRAENLQSGVFTGARQVWTNPGNIGRNQLIAIIDTGIDYTHADFGGAGTPEAFEANDGTLIEPGSFPTPKVVAGYDFVGDGYDYWGDGRPSDTAAPDEDPLDCDGHGTHVAGSAAGIGVNADGTTYTGAYTDKAVAANPWRIGPGMAPGARLAGYRVFGCAGSAGNDVIIAAIDRAVADGATVINMSLGSDWGRMDTVDAVAADNAMLAGTLVVMSAGNAGPAPYIVGAPSTSKLGLSVAAMDVTPTFPGARIDPTGADISALNANEAALPVTGEIALITDGDALSLGCAAEDFGDVTGKIAVVARGTCARVDKVVAGQAAGAAGVIMVNNVAGYPPFEGALPDVTIPFLGVETASQAALRALDGTTVTVEGGDIANPDYLLPTTFTSGGPRGGDGGAKPDVMAPGAAIYSAAVGTGSGEIAESGTSMASPITAGVAALVRAARPNFSAIAVKNAIISTARRDAAKLAADDMRLSGNGVVSATAAVRTRQYFASGSGAGAVNFEVQDLTGAFRKTGYARIYNRADAPVTYDIAARFNGPRRGATVTVSPSRVTVPARGYASVRVTLALSAAAAEAIPVDLFGDALATIRGRLVATPDGPGSAISLPFLLVPHPRSDVGAIFGPAPAAPTTAGTISLANKGAFGGTFDLYSLLLADGSGDGEPDARAVGAQFLDPGELGEPGDVWVNLALTLNERIPNAAASYWEIALDVNGDEEVDTAIVVTDYGYLTSGYPDGDLATFVIDATSGDVIDIWDAVAPLDGSVVLAGFLASEAGMTPDSGPAALTAYVQGAETFDEFDGVATITPFDPQTSQGDFVELAGGASESVEVTTRAADPDEIPALGWLGITLENPAGPPQSALLGLAR